MSTLADLPLDVRVGKGSQTDRRPRTAALSVRRKSAGPIGGVTCGNCASIHCVWLGRQFSFAGATKGDRLAAPQ
jgi:hypothetical protein